jgi:hypothetical protein
MTMTADETTTMTSGKRQRLERYGRQLTNDNPKPSR